MPSAGVRLIRMSRSPAGLDENDTGIATSMAVFGTAPHAAPARAGTILACVSVRARRPDDARCPQHARHNCLPLRRRLGNLLRDPSWLFGSGLCRSRCRNCTGKTQGHLFLTKGMPDTTARICSVARQVVKLQRRMAARRRRGLDGKGAKPSDHQGFRDARHLRTLPKRSSTIFYNCAERRP